MTKKDLFRILIKIFALYSIITSIFYILPSLTSNAFIGLDLYTIILLTATTLVIVGLFVFLIFSTDKVIRMLELDKGFDEPTINLKQLDSFKIVKFSCIIIGTFILIENIPYFLSHIYYIFKDQMNNNGFSVADSFLYQEVDYFNFLITSSKIILSYILITNNTRISKWLDKADKKNS